MVAVSKGMQAVKLCTNKILQFLPVGAFLQLGPFCSWGLSAVGAFLQLGPFCCWGLSAVGAFLQLGPFCRLPAASPGGG